MKVKDKYEEIKCLHQDEVVLFKVGSFYVTFSKDAIVLNYLFSYQVNNGKLGFPISAFEKVCANLKEKKVLRNSVGRKLMSLSKFSVEQLPCKFEV